MNTFINKCGIIMVTNVRIIQNVANIYGYIRVSTKDQNEQRQLGVPPAFRKKPTLRVCKNLREK